MFVLPRIELTECAGASILACNVAWDAEHASSDGRAVSSVGFASLDAAVMDAAAALNVVRPPALPSAPALRFSRGDVEHTPSRVEWERRLDEIYEHLQPVDILEGEAGVNSASSPLKLDPNAALDEYMRNGQQGLDDLLDALQGGSQAVVSPLRDSNGSTVDSLQSIKHGEGNNNTPHDDADASTASAPKARRGGTRGEGGLTKVVLARKTEMRIHGVIDPLALLQALQDRDPRAYQVMLQLPSGTTFLASTPERLYARTGQDVASEAVAGTRARGPGGDVEKDFWLSFDLLRSPKDDVEFSVVRDWLQGALGALCQDVTVEVAKSVLKQGAVQHLYSKLAGKLLPGMGDAALLNALHPTPAVCGQPRSKALDVLHAVEPFDRGYYAGPFGWIAQDAAEFVVAIRSALLTPCGRPDGSLDASASAPTSVRNSGVLSVRSAEAKNNLQQGVTSATYPPSAAPLSPAHVGRATVTTGVSLYAGVGIVSGSDTASEWAELDLKASQFERLLLPAPQAPDAPNLPSLWCRLAVEELCRLGCNTFCVAPGMRAHLTPYIHLVSFVDFVQLCSSQPVDALGKQEP
jgi:isochorismate synthase / 2-succinyl-5-enolpyruvyl-6-hydroxy-3-cyclohexene-1-carboxylate synthase / 2-succinyl-6-hydroxy-2,4-cyclohexadiene-1-carboxylate synthase / o-succinylbenzoate synthase